MYHFLFGSFCLKGGNDKPTKGGREGDKKTQVLEMCEHRR